MKPSREEVLRVAQECFHAYSEWHIDLECLAAAMYEAGAAAERAVSDRLLEALKQASTDLWANEMTSCGRRADAIVAEVEAMRKEDKE